MSIKNQELLQQAIMELAVELQNKAVEWEDNDDSALTENQRRYAVIGAFVNALGAAIKATDTPNEMLKLAVGALTTIVEKNEP